MKTPLSQMSGEEFVEEVTRRAYQKLADSGGPTPTREEQIVFAAGVLAGANAVLSLFQEMKEEERK